MAAVKPLNLWHSPDKESRFKKCDMVSQQLRPAHTLFQPKTRMRVAWLGQKLKRPNGTKVEWIDPASAIWMAWDDGMVSSGPTGCRRPFLCVFFLATDPNPTHITVSHPCEAKTVPVALSCFCWPTRNVTVRTDTMHWLLEDATHFPEDVAADASAFVSKSFWFGNLWLQSSWAMAQRCIHAIHRAHLGIQHGLHARRT